MRRKDREITDVKVIEEILTSGSYGVLSTVGDDGCPYGVPINYVYFNNCIYLHCAAEGHKLDNIRNNPQVSFCVVAVSEVLPAKFTTRYKSVIAYGMASEIANDARNPVLMALVEKYSPDYMAEGEEYVNSGKEDAKIIKIDIRHMTGKERR